MRARSARYASPRARTACGAVVRGRRRQQTRPAGHRDGEVLGDERRPGDAHEREPSPHLGVAHVVVAPGHDERGAARGVVEEPELGDTEGAEACERLRDVTRGGPAGWG